MGKQYFLARTGEDNYGILAMRRNPRDISNERGIIVFDYAPFNEQVRFIDSIISLKEKWESNGEETTEES